jgi:hypothetical protein
LYRGFDREKPERTKKLGRPRSRCSDNSKIVLTDIMGRRELNSSDSGQESVASAFEHARKTSVPVKWGNFLTLRNYSF